MITCLDAGWRGIRNLGNLIKPEFIVISKVECQLLLGRKQKNSLLQFHRHLIIKVDIIIALNQVDTCGFDSMETTSCLRLLIILRASLVAMR